MGGGKLLRKGGVTVAVFATLLVPLLLLALAAPASALPTPNTIRVSASSSSTFVNSYFSFSWEIKLNSTTPTSAIGDTALYIDNQSHGPGNFGYWDYASRVTGSTTDGRNFTASIHAPAVADRLYIIAMANVSGVTVYNTFDQQAGMSYGTVRTKHSVTAGSAAINDVMFRNSVEHHRTMMSWNVLD